MTALLFATGLALAQEPFDAKLQAPIFKTRLVQALDECASPTTVINGVGACAPANADTDGTSFSIGNLIVKSRNVNTQVVTILKSGPNAGIKASLGGLEVNTRLVLRVSRKSPAVPATYQDLVLDCPSAVVTGTGNVVTRNTLVQCGLPPGVHLEEYQRQIVSASVVNTATGEAIAVPGVRRR